MNDEVIVQEGAVDGAKKRKHGPGHLLVGKIARLPKAIREQVNRRIDNGEPASSLAAWLNELPTVKNVLASYFGGTAISQKNISNWRLTGYQRWVERQEVLAEVKELAEEAAEINETSADGLMRMTATLACTKLLRTLRDEKSAGADVVKIGFAIAALNNVEVSRVRVEHEERRLEQKDDLVGLAWDKHLRNCAEIALRVLNDWQAKAVQQAPCDNSVKIELLGRRMFGCLWKKRKIPGEDEMFEAQDKESPEDDEKKEAETQTKEEENGASDGGESEGEPSPHLEPAQDFNSNGSPSPLPSPAGRGGIVVRGLEMLDDSIGSEVQRANNFPENLGALGGTPNAATGTVALPVSVGEGKQPQKNTKITKSGEDGPLTPTLSPDGGEGEPDAQEYAHVMRPNTVSDETQDTRVMRPTMMQVGPAVVKECAEKKKGPGLIGRIGRIFGSGSKDDAGGSTVHGEGKGNAEALGDPPSSNFGAAGTPNAATGTVALPISVGEGKQPQKNTKSGEGRPLTPTLSPDGGEGENSRLAKPLLSDYEKARLEGKSHLEAMYAQFSPAKNPPPPRAPRPLEPFPDPVLAYRCIMSRQDPLRPAPGYNSLG